MKNESAQSLFRQAEKQASLPINVEKYPGREQNMKGLKQICKIGLYYMFYNLKITYCGGLLIKGRW
jgi:hypothetical protein